MFHIFVTYLVRYGDYLHLHHKQIKFMIQAHCARNRDESRKKFMRICINLQPVESSVIRFLFVMPGLLSLNADCKIH